MANAVLTLPSLPGVNDVLCYQGHAYPQHGQWMLYKGRQNLFND